ncbi:hypothetical protein AB6A40_007990 [Gnathostoma spinigerum]|uniref:EGF-like domain-containing protein n=1 Tax=Gnathostoma spinigerum TaxID=75299 RepID=A0ABD6EUZ7_9BILA
MYFLYLLFLSVTVVQSQRFTKDIIHFCDPNVTSSCGPDGKCMPRKTGNRCKCPSGFMGKACKRPCQDIYKSCDQWKEESRCTWAHPISPFFEDNCAASCHQCVIGKTKLVTPLPPILEPLAWLIGRWETETTAGLRYPASMVGPYREVLEIVNSDVPMFDRPPLNITVRAESVDGSDHHVEVGFITGKPFKEDTGFMRRISGDKRIDKVAIEMVSNAGLITIEEGYLKNRRIKLALKYERTIFPTDDPNYIKNSSRSFKLISRNRLREHGKIVDRNGKVRQWSKQYRKTFDYLSPVFI